MLIVCGIFLRDYCIFMSLLLALQYAPSLCHLELLCRAWLQAHTWGQVSYRSSVNVWGSGLAMESSMMNSGTLFECGPLPPPYVHLPSSWHHAHDESSQDFSIFLPFYCFHFILNANWRTRMGKAWEQGTSGCYWGLSKVLAQMTKLSISDQCIIVANSFCRRPGSLYYNHV